MNVSSAKFFPEIETTTEQEMAAWKGLFRRTNVFAILPTGAGKSLIYQFNDARTCEDGTQQTEGGKVRCCCVTVTVDNRNSNHLSE